MGIIEAAAGLGLMVGPMLGSLFYSSIGYLWTFIVFSIFMFFNCIFLYFSLSPEMNNKPTEEEEKARADSIRSRNNSGNYSRNFSKNFQRATSVVSFT